MFEGDHTLPDYKYARKKNALIYSAWACNTRLNTEQFGCGESGQLYRSGSLTASDELGRNVPGIAQRAQNDAARRQNADPGDGGVIQRDAQPRFRRELQSTVECIAICKFCEISTSSLRNR